MLCVVLALDVLELGENVKAEAVGLAALRAAVQVVADRQHQRQDELHALTRHQHLQATATPNAKLTPSTPSNELTDTQ